MTDIDDRLHSALGERYAFDRELGSGGMATVYLAEDLKHHRPVALKVLRPDLAAALGPERFLREIEIAARLTHPHILPLHDSGEADGFLYYVMPYIEGETLRDRLSREKQLPLEDALNIACEVADALSYAHSHGVVHRDIKPENVLLSGSHAVVADFGIARAVTAAGGVRLTATGIAVGTPLYMSPEQGSGSDNLDGRSDIYSLGCLLYEMLAGQPPFIGPTTQAVIARHVNDPVPPITTVRPSVRANMAQAITKALAKVPADRFTTPSEFARALIDEEAGRDPSMVKSIAVLPFANVSPNPDDEYLSDGITEEIINALTKLEGLRVVSRTSAFAFKGKNEDIRSIGEHLNVSSVLEGSVRKAGNRLRVTAQLVNAADGYHFWSQRYDREMTDVFAVQDEIAGAIVNLLQGKLAAQKHAEKVKHYTDNVAAYELYLKGRYVEKTRTRDGLAKGIEYFEQTISQASRYAPAYAGLADSYYLMAWYRYLPTKEAFPTARTAAARALEIDDTLAEAHTSQGVVRFYYEWDWPGAEYAFRRALDLNPNDPIALHGYAEYLAAMHRLDEALVMISRAHALDPLSLTINAGLGWVHYFSRRYDEAIERLKKTLDLDPDYVFLNWFLGQAYMKAGKQEEAVSAFRRGMGRSGGHPGMAAYLAYACARSGRRDEALKVFRELEESSKEAYVPADYLSVVCLGLGQTEEAYQWLEKACEERALHLVFLGVDPLFDDLRGDEKFTHVLQKIGLQRA